MAIDEVVILKNCLILLLTIFNRLQTQKLEYIRFISPIEIFEHLEALPLLKFVKKSN